MSDNQITSTEISLEILHKENILPYLPLMNQWFIQAFQKPPYCYAGPSTQELVDPQDLFYVNDPHGIVIIAKKNEEIVGVAAGLPFDSKYLLAYLESRHKGTLSEIIAAGFDPVQMFYLSYILTSPKFKNKKNLSSSIFDAIKNWASLIGKNQICWQEDVSLTIDLNEKVEEWKEYVTGFNTMGVRLHYNWLTLQTDGLVQEAQHTMEFFYNNFKN